MPIPEKLYAVGIMRALRPFNAYEWFLIPQWLRRFGPLKLVSAPLMDRRALHYFTLYSSLNAVMWGAATLGSVVMRKTLGASEMQIGLVSAIGSAVLLIGIFGSELVMGRDKRPFILWVGLLSRGSLLLFLFCYNVWTFIAIISVFNILHAFLTPAVFGWWQNNVSAEARSRLWGLAAMLTTLITMAAAYFTGVALHYNPEWFRWIFAVTGLIAMYGVITLVASPMRGQYKFSEAPPATSFRQIVAQPVISFYTLLKRDRRFLQFEGAYMLYGAALMLTFPVIPVYIADAAKMNYEQAAVALGIMSQIGVILLSTAWGRMMDVRGPVVTAAWNFFFLAGFPAVLLLGPLHARIGIPLYIGVYVSHILLGIGMAGVNVTWSLAPISFAGDQDSSLYSGAHVTLTGIRGAIVPTLGALALTYLGYTPVFVASTLLFLLAAAGMALLAKRHPELARAGYYAHAKVKVAAAADAVDA